MPAVKRMQIALLAGAVGLMAFGSANADTITVTNQSDNPAIGQYQYLITFDGQAFVKGGDGFVLYDWAGLITSGSAVGSGSAPDPVGNLTPYLQFTSGPAINPFVNFSVSQQLTGNGLTDTGGSSDAADVANGAASQAASDNSLSFDNPFIPNVTFAWTDGTYDAGIKGPATAILTLYSSITPNSYSTVYGSADRSGTNPGVSYGHAGATIFAPSGVPLPASWLGAMALFGIVGLIEYRRRHQTA